MLELRFRHVVQQWRNLSCLGILACRGDGAVFRCRAYRPPSTIGARRSKNSIAQGCIHRHHHHQKPCFLSRPERSTHVAFREIRWSQSRLLCARPFYWGEMFRVGPFVKTPQASQLTGHLGSVETLLHPHDLHPQSHPFSPEPW
jgi:hypothetical protein